MLLVAVYVALIIINLTSFVIIERSAVSSIVVGSRCVGQLFINLLSFSKKKNELILFWKEDFVFEKCPGIACLTYCQSQKQKGRNGARGMIFRVVLLIIDVSPPGRPGFHFDLQISTSACCHWAIYHKKNYVLNYTII